MPARGVWGASAKREKEDGKCITPVYRQFNLGSSFLEGMQQTGQGVRRGTPALMRWGPVGAVRLSWWGITLRLANARLFWNGTIE